MHILVEKKTIKKTIFSGDKNQIFILLIGLIPIVGACGSLIYFQGYIDIESFLVACIGSFFFIIIELVLFGLLAQVDQKVGIVPANVKQSNVDNNIVRLWISIAALSTFGTVMLVRKFVDDFGFDALYMRPDLYQSNSITNSFGYLLYLNVFVFSIYFRLEAVNLRQRLIFFIIFLTSVFGLVFAGNKSYLFQALLLLTLMKSANNLSKLINYYVILLFFLIVLFGLYDYFIDLNEVESVFARPIAYIFGGWATLQASIDRGYTSTYIGDHLFYPLYKVLTFGSFSEESLFEFFEIGGFDLNQYSVFGGAYLDFSYIGVIAISVAAAVFEYFLRVAWKYKKLFVFELIYWYFICELILSFFFANMFSSLYVYVSIFVICLLHYISSFFLRLKVA